MDNLTGIKADYRSFALATRNPHTWVISFLYIGTFGSFIGYAGAFPTLLKTQFPTAPLGLAFIGALIGALTRPLGGIVADRLRWGPGDDRVLRRARRGGAGRHRGPAGQELPALLRRVPRALHRRRHRQRRDLPDDPGGVPGGGAARAGLPAARKAAAGCIGIAGAVGAYGGFFIPRGFAMAKDTYGSLVPALYVFVVAYVLMALTMYAVYQRRGSALASETI